jgi:hypothetical protein
LNLEKIIGCRVLNRRLISVGLAAWSLWAPQSNGADDFKGLEFRMLKPGENYPASNETGIPIPREAVQAFVYAGEPWSVRVTPQGIAVGYRYCGVLYDRGSGRALKTFTILDGWPKRLPDGFAPVGKMWYRHSLLVGPGVVESGKDPGFRGNPGSREKEPEFPVKAVASVEFEGNRWTAWQSGIWEVERTIRPDHSKGPPPPLAWTALLQALNQRGYLEMRPLNGGATRCFTTKDGLASNLISHLAVADGTVWAACVDIWDPEKKAWGPGGLCRYNAQASRWERVDQIDGKPVRWVTLLQAVGDELWIGYREGEGVEGDTIAYGMGVYPGEYRPVVTAVILARLKNGRFTRYLRPPVPDREPVRQWFSDKEPRKVPSPSEKPIKVISKGDCLFLLTKTHCRGSGNFNVDYDGHIWRLELTNGQWREFKIDEDFQADEFYDLSGEEGEAIAWTNRGTHQWQGGKQAWRFLDSGCALKNSALSAATPVGNQLWVGYTNQRFGVLGEQGISCYDEEKGTWSYFSPEDIGTASPVSEIASTSSGEAWVAFSERPWGGAAVEFPFFARETRLNRSRGLGHFLKGKWEFPFHPRKVDADSSARRFEYSKHAVAHGDLVCVKDGPNLFLGPNPWKLLYSGDGGGIEFATNGEGIVIYRSEYTGNKVECQRGVVNLADGKVSFEKFEDKREHWERYQVGLFRGGQYSSWAVIPTQKGGRWGVGPLEQATYAVVETPWAVWIVSDGQLIRLDRKLLKDWLLAKPSKP